MLYEVITIKPHIRNGKPYFTVRIIAEGNIGEDGLSLNPTPEDLRKIEQMLNNEIRHDANLIIQKLQNEYGLDVITSYSIHYTKLYDILAAAGC